MAPALLCCLPLSSRRALFARSPHRAALSSRFISWRYDDALARAARGNRCLLPSGIDDMTARRPGATRASTSSARRARDVASSREGRHLKAVALNDSKHGPEAPPQTSARFSACSALYHLYRFPPAAIFFCWHQASLIFYLLLPAYLLSSPRGRGDLGDDGLARLRSLGRSPEAARGRPREYRPRSPRS